jgi:UDP:flavonoid glycosyltransferase YjiC (YdhE family)
MRIGIHTLGTRGDFQPYLALAMALRAAGHEVLLVAPAQFAAAASRGGIGFAPLPASFLELLDDPEFGAMLAGGKSTWAAKRRLFARYRPVMAAVLDTEAQAAAAFAPELIVHHPKSLAAPLLAARRARPAVLASPLPGFTPTAAFPSPLVPWRSLGPLNRLSHTATAHAGWLLWRGMLREWSRRTLGTAAARPPPPAGTLYAYSPAVVPPPPEWGADVLVSGYWFDNEEAWQPPAGLLDFLAAGAPPVYVGFGSMPVADPPALTRLVLDALQRCGLRAVIAAGWGGLGAAQLPPQVHRIGQAPHAWLLPRMAAVVHHGGAGTTAAGLRAGRPNVICPFLGDQPFWGRRVADLGAGPQPLAIRSLDAQALAAALRQAAQPQVVHAAQALGARIRAERGLDAAVAFIERTAAAWRPA